LISFMISKILDDEGARPREGSSSIKASGYHHACHRASVALHLRSRELVVLPQDWKGRRLSSPFASLSGKYDPRIRFSSTVMGRIFSPSVCTIPSTILWLEVCLILSSKIMAPI
jgi:hypothetical protein